MSAAVTASTALIPQVLIQYDLNEDQIAKLATDYAGVTFDDPAAYSAGVKAIAHVRTLRTSVESRRKDLKEDSLKVGRMIDSAAKKLTAALEAIETPLKERKAAVDEAKERARRAEEERLRDEQAAAAKLAQEAEDKRLADERAKLAAQEAAFEARRAAADAERAAAEEIARVERERVAGEQRAAQDKIDAARAEVEAQLRAVRAREEAAARVEADRLAKEKADREAADQAERDRLAAEEDAARAAELAAAEAARLEAMAPDIERVHRFSARVRAFAADLPVVTDAVAVQAMEWTTKRLIFVADALAAFPGPGK